MAWRLGRHQAHLIVMWSIPYNLNIFNSYFAVGMASLSSRFRWLRCPTCRYQPPAWNFYIYSKDMLPFWYREMIRKWTINVNEWRFFSIKVEESAWKGLAIVDGSVPGDSGQQGKQFSRSEGGEDIVFKHRDLFVIGMFESGYHPVLNIRYRYLPRNM